MVSYGAWIQLFGWLPLSVGLIGCTAHHAKELSLNASAGKPGNLAEASGSGSNSAAVSMAGVQNGAEQLPTIPNYSWFQLRPFKVAESNSIYGWTGEDGRDTNVILRLAHNSLEYQRMVMENAAIYQRELVYFNEGLASLAQEAAQAGEKLRQITLPGLDGQQWVVNVTRTDLRDNGSAGQIYGQLPGQADSTVTAAFINNREAFTVDSPQEQVYLVGEAREPGELVVKSINPALYGSPFH